MNMTRDRVQSIGWLTLLIFCAVLTGALVLRVNAVKSQVQITERQIIALKRENQFLATEYETRANQQSLSAINDLNFGFKAPEAAQYLENERQLAVLGKPRAADAPAPIQVASADTGSAYNNGDRGTMSAIVPQLTSHLVPRAAAAEVPEAGPAAGMRGQVDAGNLRARLSRLDPASRVDSPGHSE